MNHPTTFRRTLCLLLVTSFSPFARAESMRVACLGDSITAGAWVDAKTESYPAQLQQFLGGESQVRNFGIGGATLLKAGKPNVWQSLRAVREFNPHVVIVSLGTNDTVGEKRKNWERIGAFEGDFGELIDHLAKLPARPRIVICTPTAMVLDTPGLSKERLADLKERRPRLQDLCSRIRALADEHRAKKVELLELNSVLAGHPELLTPKDGVHPNAAGYRAIAKVVAAAVQADTPRKPQAAKQPNIVFFLVDDMGWQDTSEPFHSEPTALNRRYRTPNMERLARQGMKFTQAYACAVCSPTRVSLMTGQNAARHRVTNWTLRKDKSPDPGNPSVQPPAWNVNGLSPTAGVARTVQAVTLPMLLRKAGYRTIHVGKAHFGAAGTPGADPTHLGFDVNIAGHAAGGPGSYYGQNNFSAAFRQGDRIWDVPGLEKYHGQDAYLTDVLTTEANGAIDRAVADDQPFYLYMAHYAVHAPFEADPQTIGRYREAGLKGLPATFASMLESMDRSLGAILDNLQRLGIENETIVVFMSDNGSPGQTPRNLPLRGHKLTPYEGGIRVPLIVRWPGVTKADSTCRQYMIIEDIFPTFLEMAGVKHYEQIGGAIDGVSFVPLLKQQPGETAQRAIFWHYPNTYGQAPYSAVRQGAWKLIYHHAGQRYELFNLEQDLSEAKNLAQSEPAIRDRLARLLHDYLKLVDAPMPTDRRTGQPVPLPAG